MALKWRHYDEDRVGIERAKYSAFGLRILVEDYDGDDSRWQISEGDRVLASGEVLDGPNDEYHMDTAMKLAEESYRKILAQRGLVDHPDPRRPNEQADN